jgi:hypothetical protein
VSTIESVSLPEIFAGWDPGLVWLLAVIAIGCSVGLILGLAGILSSTLGSIQRHRAELGLKREMLDRGMSADEIAKVISATQRPGDGG